MSGDLVPVARVGIVDASCVARNGLPVGRVRRLVSVLDFLHEHGTRVICIADASLRYAIDDQSAYQKLVDEGVVLQAPADSSADTFIIELEAALHMRGVESFVVSNDSDLSMSRFLGRTLKFMFIPWDEGEILLTGIRELRDSLCGSELHDGTLSRGSHPHQGQITHAFSCDKERRCSNPPSEGNVLLRW